MKNRGFTLIELATSSLSVSVLLALALPALSEARRQAKQVHCLTNLSRIAEASTIYATADRNERAIPVHHLIGLLNGAVGTYEWGGKSGAGQPLQGNSSTESLWGTQIGRGPATRPLNKIVYGDVFTDFYNDPGPGQSHWLADTRIDVDVFRCPADYGYAGHHDTAWQESGLTSYDHFGNSYAASQLWVGAPGSGCKIMSNSAYLRPISRIPNAANTLLYLENCGLFAWRKSYGGDGCSFLNGGPLGSDVETAVRGWHGAWWKFNTAFVDGHVQTIRMEGHEHPQFDIGRFPDFMGSQTEWSFWHCAIIRGPGWQIDTLPAPPVPTSIGCTRAVATPIG